MFVCVCDDNNNSSIVTLLCRLVDYSMLRTPSAICSGALLIPKKEGEERRDTRRHLDLIHSD